MTTKTTIYDLYPDILFCIFEYFTINELYEIFSEIIPHITSLIINSHIRLHLRDSIIPNINPAQIISLELPCLPRLASSSLSEFINLRSLILHDMEDPQLLINQSLSQFLEILHLNISLRNKPTIILSLLSLITQLPQLKSCTLIYPSSYFILKSKELILEKSSITIKYIQLDLKCSINSLEKLLKHLPYLKHLQATLVSSLHYSNTSLETLLFPNIEYLSISWDYIPFVDILTFCKKMIHLKTCIFNTSNYHNDYNIFNPLIWREFIEEDHVMLKKCIVKMKRQPSHNMQRIPNSFTSMINDPYFHSINFKIKIDSWGNFVLKGNYIKST